MSFEAGDSVLVQKIANVKKICQQLQSGDRKVRKNAYAELESYFKSNEFSNEELRNIYNESYMHILNGFRDKAEIVREQAIKFVSFLILEKLPLNDYYLTYIFPVLVERVGTPELIEESEEIRLELLELLSKIISHYSNTTQLKPFLNDCVLILSQSVQDKFPKVKELACITIVNLAKALSTDFHMQAENLIKPVLSCFNHQRFKIRVEAVKAIGEIVIHGSYKAVDEVVGPMAERLFDQKPAVRCEVAKVAARWLMEYRDRYSFFQKILPLLLTGLNDEVEDTRQVSQALWLEVGKQYLQENEKDLKDQLDYLTTPPKYYLEGCERPNLGCRVLVQRNIGKMAPALANELNSWQEDIQLRCSQLLCSLVLLAEAGVTQHLQILFPAMYSAARNADQKIAENIFRASEIIAIFVPPDSWIRLVMPAIENGAHYGQIKVLSGLVKGTPKECMQEKLEEVVGLLADDSICGNRNIKFINEMKKCVYELSLKYNKDFDKSSDRGSAYKLFKISLTLLALNNGNIADFTTDFLQDILSKNLQIDLDYMWEKYTPFILEDIDREPKLWKECTQEACIFLLVLQESNLAFGQNLNAIIQILAPLLDQESDPDLRLKVFYILANIFEAKKAIIFKKSSTEELHQFLEHLITDIFVPSLVWHPGNTAEAIRTMATACLKCVLLPLENVNLFASPDVLRPIVDKLTPLLLSLIEDASYRSRQLAIECLALLKDLCCQKSIWSVDDLIKIYPEMLKRLDDPTELVRITCLQYLGGIFDKWPEEFENVTYKAHHELIVDTLMTHFDDDDDKVQSFVFEILKVVAGISRQDVIKKIERHRPLLRNQKGCDELLQCILQN